MPFTLASLISHSSLIVIGEVGPVVRSFDFAGYAEDGAQAMPGESGSAPTIPATDFQLIVEETLRDDGRIARGEPVILRSVPLSERELEVLTEMELGFDGKRTLFLLAANPDEKTYTLPFGPYSQIEIRDNKLFAGDLPGSPVILGNPEGQLTLEEFIAAVNEAQPGEDTDALVPVSPLPTPAAPGALVPMAPGGAVSAPVPASLAAFIQGAPLIFVGQVGPVDRFFDFAGYTADGSLAVPGENGAPPALPATDFRLIVERPLRDDGRIASGEPIHLRMAPLSETDVQALDRLGLGLEGKRYLFALQRNPDGQSYGPGYGPLSLLIIDGDRLLLSDGANTPLQFPGNVAPVTLEAFVAAVQDQE